MPNAWKEVKLMHTSFLKEVEKTIPGYSYADKAKAFSTNQKLGEHMVSVLRNAKAKLFEIVEFLYEVQSEKVSGHFEKYRNELDHLSDRIKVRHFEWHNLPEEFLDRVVALDKEMLKTAGTITSIIEEIYRLSVGFQRVDHKVFDVKGIEKASKKLEKTIRDITLAFEKRSALLDIREADLEADYDRIVKEIEGKF